MKAVYIDSPGPDVTFQYGDMPTPAIKDDQVLVQVAYAAINNVDTLIAKGAVKMVNLPSPFALGRDMCGTVVKVGRSVSGFAVGDRVWTNSEGIFGRQGTYAEYSAVDGNRLYKLPKTVDPKEFIAGVHAGFTAHYGLCQNAHISEKDVVFIKGGSGNVGSAMIQVAKRIGAKVIATASDEAKRDWCTKLGADKVIAREAVPEGGVTLFCDTSGEDNLGQVIPVMSDRGRILLMAGFGKKVEFTAGPYYYEELRTIGFAVTKAHPDELAIGADYLNCNPLQVRVDQVYKLADVPQVLTSLAPGKTWGKMVIEVGGLSKVYPPGIMGRIAVLWVWFLSLFTEALRKLFQR